MLGFLVPGSDTPLYHTQLPRAHPVLLPYCNRTRTSFRRKKSLLVLLRRPAAGRPSRPSFATELAPFFIRPCARNRRSLTAAVEIPNLVATSSVESSITFRRTQTLRSSAGSSAILSAMMRNRSLRAYDASGFSRQARDSNLWDSFRTGSPSSSGTNLPDCLRRTKSIAEFAVIRINHERKSPFVSSCVPENRCSFVKAFNNDSWQTSSASSTFRVRRRANRRRRGTYGVISAAKASLSPVRAAARTSNKHSDGCNKVALMQGTSASALPLVDLP
jgi:hypothetical protein